MDRVERIVAGLTLSERQALLRHPVHLTFDWAVFSLIVAGLMTLRRRWWLFGPKMPRLTFIGLRVRGELVLQAAYRDLYRDG